MQDGKIQEKPREQLEAIVSFLDVSSFSLKFSASETYEKVLKKISQKLKLKEKVAIDSLSLSVDNVSISSQKAWNSFLKDRTVSTDPLESLCSSLSSLSLAPTSSSPYLSPLFFTVGLKCLAPGGKGGFGAELRAKARQRGKKITKDFGSCRDLYGRRLRDVNNQIILEKWAEAKRTGKEFDIEQETSSGIDLWFLAVPSWSEGLKSDKKKSYIKAKSKTSMCNDWLRAREFKAPPPGAPIHWGCPRGSKCEFAHGEEDLRGDLGDLRAREKDEEARRQKQKEHDDFFNPILKSELGLEAELGAILSKGLKPGANQESPQSTSSLQDKIRLREKKAQQQNQNFFELLSGQVLIERLREPEQSVSSSSDQKVSDIFILTASSKFPTFSVNLSKLANIYQKAGQSVSQEGRRGLYFGHYYYEIELLSDGLMQLGWVSSHFSGGNDEEGEGVGDDKNSWAYDGFRQKIWHNGEGQVYGILEKDEAEKKNEPASEDNEESQFSWSQGDVIGCFFSACLLPDASRQVSFSYAKNGVHLGTAFDFVIRDSGPLIHPSEEEKKKRSFSQTTSAWLDSNLSFFPSISLEENESVALRFDNFKFDPQASIGSSVSFKSLQQYDQLELGQQLPIPVAEPVPSSASVVSETKEAQVPLSIDIPLNLSDYPDPESLMALGLDVLKQDLMARGLKAGGTLQERAQRLDQIRALKPEEYPASLRAKEKKK